MFWIFEKNYYLLWHFFDVFFRLDSLPITNQWLSIGYNLYIIRRYILSFRWFQRFQQRSSRHTHFTNVDQTSFINKKKKYQKERKEMVRIGITLFCRITKSNVRQWFNLPLAVISLAKYTKPPYKFQTAIRYKCPHSSSLYISFHWVYVVVCLNIFLSMNDCGSRS